MHSNGVQFHKRQSPLVCQTGHSPLVLYSESMPAGVHRLQIPVENSHKTTLKVMALQVAPLAEKSSLLLVHPT